MENSEKSFYNNKIEGYSNNDYQYYFDLHYFKHFYSDFKFLNPLKFINLFRFLSKV